MLNKILGKLSRMSHSKAGFTLVEVLFAILILAISLTGSLLIFTKTNISMAEIKQRSIAVQAAKEEIESIRDMAFDAILTLGSSFTVTGFSDLINPVGTLTIDDPFSSNDIRRTTATVTWNSSEGRALSASLSTFLTRSGINKQ